jgi:hypothetical protein
MKLVVFAKMSIQVFWEYRKGDVDIFAKKYGFGRQLSCITFPKFFFFFHSPKKIRSFLGRKKWTHFVLFFGHFEFLKDER